jgi:hypothetical protein
LPFSRALALLLFAGCNNLLEVDNPNNMLEESLSDPAAAAAIANGVLSTGSNGIGYCLAPYTTVTDKGIWIDSRDAWNQLDKGNITDFNNEFVDAAWPFITEARYTADNAITRLEGFRSAGTLRDVKILARAYLYSAMIRVTIGDMFDDFVYSNKQEAQPPIGEANMSQVYDQAIDHLNKAYDIAKALTGNSRDVELERRILGLRARAKQSKAIWQKINPRPVSAATLANPYVTEGVDDAQAALALPMAANYRWQLQYPGSIGAFNEWAFEVVSRQELNAIPAKDIIDTATDDPRIVAEIADFKDRTKYGGDRNSPFTVISEREMQLIIAEAQVVSDPAGAAAILNALRARNSLQPLAAPFTTATVGPLLQHERFANLFMMGRRLADMYRFGIKDARWSPTAEAVTVPGSFLPITIQERRANPYLTGGR